MAIRRGTPESGTDAWGYSYLQSGHAVSGYPKPTYIFCSATIANPGQLGSELLGAPVEVIDQSGAPVGEKHLLFWNPPLIDPDLGLRPSARSQTTRIARSAIKAGLKTIVFANTRLMAEVLTKYLKDVFDNDPRQAPRIAAYRGGYLPTERRRHTATRLRGGELDCVVTTNALELGIDIGGLDVCILNGFPGTIAGTWQRLGRAGRRSRPALGVLIATSDPLDQYIIRNPQFFTAASPERGCIDPDQLLILMDLRTVRLLQRKARRADGAHHTACKPLMAVAKLLTILTFLLHRAAVPCRIVRLSDPFRPALYSSRVARLQIARRK